MVKTNLVTFLCLAMALLFEGCARRLTPEQRVAELVQPGKEVLWPDGRVLHVERREGNKLEGVRLAGSKSTIAPRTVEAKSGTIQIEPDGVSVRVTLFDAVIRVGTNRLGQVKEFSALVRR